MKHEFGQDPEVSAYVQRLMRHGCDDGVHFTNPLKVYEKMVAETITILHLIAEMARGEETIVNGERMVLDTFEQAMRFQTLVFINRLKQSVEAAIEMQLDPKFIEFKSRFAAHVAMEKMFNADKNT